MSFDSGSQKSEDVTALLAAGFDHRQHGLDEADDATPELVAFWKYLKREFHLPHADTILEFLREVEPDFPDMMNDPANFGMAKSFFTMGRPKAPESTRCGLQPWFHAHFGQFSLPNGLGSQAVDPRAAADQRDQDDRRRAAHRFHLRGSRDKARPASSVAAGREISAHCHDTASICNPARLISPGTMMERDPKSPQKATSSRTVAGSLGRHRATRPRSPAASLRR